MLKRSKTGRILHGKRPFTPNRPLHITLKVRDDVPDLRREDIERELSRILAGAKARGLRVLNWSLLGNHLHMLVMAPTTEVLGDAMRYVNSQLARAINKLFARKGSVFEERYWSTLCKSVKQAWIALGYILRNPFAAGRLRRDHDGFDRFSGVDEDALLSNRFLRSFLGMPREDLRRLLRRMVTERVPFIPLGERLQPRLL